MSVLRINSKLSIVEPFQIFMHRLWTLESYPCPESALRNCHRFYMTEVGPILLLCELRINMTSKLILIFVLNKFATVISYNMCLCETSFRFEFSGLMFHFNAIIFTTSSQIIWRRYFQYANLIFFFPENFTLINISLLPNTNYYILLNDFH